MRKKKMLQKHLPETMGTVISGSWMRKQTLPLACISLLVSALQKSQTCDSWVWEGLWGQIRDKHHLCPQSSSVPLVPWFPSVLLLRVSQYHCQCCQDWWDDGGEEPRLCASGVTLLRSPCPSWSTQTLTVTSSWFHLSPWSFSDSSSWQYKTAHSVCFSY